MSEIHQQEIYKGYNINVYRDESPESPREWDNLGIMYTMHRNYEPEKNFYKHFEWEEVFDEHRDLLSSFDKKYIALKFYLYDHSGQTVSTSPFSCSWDSGLFGIIAVDIEKVKKEFNWKKITKKRREQIESYLEGEVETLNDYYTGDVYGFQIVKSADENEDVLDSCWGHFGDSSIEEIKKECKCFIDGLVKEELKQRKRDQLEQIRKYGIQLFLPFPDLELSTEI